MAASMYAHAYGQCGSETFNVTDWCENQYAQWEITNADPNSTYEWFEETSPGVYNSLGFGTDGRGTEFVSPFRYTTPTPEPAGTTWDDRTFFYRKNTDVSGFVPRGALDINGQDANRTAGDYIMDFTIDNDTRFNSIKFPAQLFQNAPYTYYIQVRVGTEFSPIFYFTRDDVTQITGQIYEVEVPLGLDLLAGTYDIEIITNPASPNAGTNPIDGFRWFSTVAANQGPFTEPGVVSATPVPQNIFSQTRLPVIYDWDLTYSCDYIESPIANKTTVGCCNEITTPIDANASETVVQSGVDNSTLTVAIFNDLNNYFIWYRDGVAIPGQSGQGINGFDQIL